MFQLSTLKYLFFFFIIMNNSKNIIRNYRFSENMEISTSTTSNSIGIHDNSTKRRIYVPICDLDNFIKTLKKIKKNFKN